MGCHAGDDDTGDETKEGVILPSPWKTITNDYYEVTRDCLVRSYRIVWWGGYNLGDDVVGTGPILDSKEGGGWGGAPLPPLAAVGVQIGSVDFY